MKTNQKESLEEDEVASCHLNQKKDEEIGDSSWEPGRFLTER